MTKIKFYDAHGSYSVAVNEVDMSVDEVMHMLIVPVLLAAGYSKENIEDYFQIDEKK